MKIHILGICGTYMTGVAQLAKELGHDVTGSDDKYEQPMSAVLRDAGITLYEGYEIAHVKNVELVIVGNVISRGHDILEYIIEEKIDENGCYQSFIEISQNMLKQLEDLENFKDLKPVS